MIPDIISFIMYLKYVVNEWMLLVSVSLCYFLIWDLSFSHDFSDSPACRGGRECFYLAPWGVTIDRHGIPSAEQTFFVPWDSNKLRLVRLLLLLIGHQKSGIHSPVEWTVVYPIIYKVFIHPRWLFGISEPSEVCSRFLVFFFSVEVVS